MTGTMDILGPLERVARAITRSAHRQKFLPLPKRVTPELIATLIHAGVAFTASSDPYIAAKQVREAGDRLAILPLDHRVSSEESNQVIKDVRAGWYLHIDSAPVVRMALQRSRDFATRLHKGWGLPENRTIDSVTHLSDGVLEMSGMYPKFQYAAAFDDAIERKRGGTPINPPIGLYWVGPDRKVRAITWMRSVNGHDKYRAARDDRINVTLDKEFYGRDSMSATVESESHLGTFYPLVLGLLPIFRAHDRKQHSSCRAFETTDNDPDARYRGRKDQRRSKKRYFISSNTIMIYDLCAQRLREEHELGQGVEIQINPFPEVRPFGREMIRFMNEQVLIGLGVPNLTETDRIVGADTINQGGYFKNFYNWTFRG